MMIPPPVEKKSSSAFKWIFRLLVITVLLVAAAMFVLNILSGTSDAHRHGLEQAMSDMFKSQVKIAHLNQFNIAPQFVINMGEIDGIRQDGMKFTISKAHIAFGFLALLTKDRIIEDIQLENIIMSAGMVGGQQLIIEEAGIIHSSPAYFQLSGRYGDASFSARVQLDLVRSLPRPAYRIGETEPLELTLGKFRLKGDFTQTDEGFPLLKNAILSFDDNNIATGTLSFDTSAKPYHFRADMSFESGKVNIEYVPDTGHQSWNFDQLDSDSLYENRISWIRAHNAWKQIAPSGALPQLQPPVTRVEIDLLEGTLSGKDLKGYFISHPDRIEGWWTGNIQGLPEQKVKDAVSCGLLKLSVQKSLWSGFSYINADKISDSASISFNDKTGDISYHTVKATPQINVLLSKLKNLPTDQVPFCRDLSSLIDP